jgi:hypothetical protein
MKDAAEAGKPIAAQNASEMLAPAGLFFGRQVAFAPGVVRDRNLLTSYNCPYTARGNGKPDDTRELVKQFLKALASR